nr:response regulator transcription factor [Granulicella mallensis]
MSVEDHPIFREGLNSMITSEPDLHLVAEAISGSEAVAAFRTHRPDITLMDFRMPGLDGIAALKAIRREFQSARIIMLTTSEGDVEIRKALRAGASAYMLKSMPKAEILAAIRSVHDGGRCVPPEVAAKIAMHLGGEHLTVRELEVLALIRDGHANKQVADILGIAETTVNFHISNLVKKLKANDRTHAMAIAVRRGFLEI